MRSLRLASLSLALLTLAIPGRSVSGRYAAPVRVVTDRWGIPHVRARNERDLYRAWGWVTARDRLWQLVYARAQGRGQVHRWLGNRALRSDGGAQLFRLAERARAIWARDRADSALRARVEGYCAGINDYMDDLDARLEPAPPELAALHIKPERWRPEDSMLLLLGFGVTLDLDLPELDEADRIREIGLERARARGRYEARWIYDTIPTDATPAPGARDGGALGPGARGTDAARAHDPRDADRITVPPEWRIAAQLAGGDAMRTEADPDLRASNVFVVGGRRTASGAPLLANDPHLALSSPGAFHVVHLSVPGVVEAIGAAVPGLPAIVSGRSPRCAWGVTALGADVIDVWTDSLSTDGKHIRTADGWAPILERPYDLRFRFAGVPIPAFGQVRRYAPRGPILVHDRKRRIALTMRWSAMQDERITLRRLVGLEQSRSADELAERWRTLVTPTLNLMAADAAGGMRYQTCGLVPKRWDDPGPGPRAGAGRTEWRGFIPADSMPAWRVPPDRFAVNANNRPGRSASRYVWPRYDWAHDRALRLSERLAGDTRVSARDAWSLQADAWSRASERWVPRLLAVVDSLSAHAPARERVALDSLRAWDHYARRSRVGATVFRAWLGALQRETNTLDKPGLLYASLAGKAPAGLAWPESLSTGAVAWRALGTVLDTLGAKLGPDLRGWAWGNANRARFAHPLADRSPALAAQWEPAAVAMDGDRSSPSVGGARLPWTTTVVHGPVFRHVVDLAVRDSSWGIVAPWNTQRAGRWQAPSLEARWARHIAVPFYLDWDRIEAARADVRVLE